jgi:ABC-2 type transport system permease protein
MNSTTIAATASGSSLARPLSRNLGRIYALEAWYEWVKMVRLPAYAVPTVLFPLVFYWFFGVAMKGASGGFDISRYLLATYGAFGVMNAALFNFGITVAVERGQGWGLLKRATPMPPFAHLCGRLAVSVVFSTLIIACLFTVGAWAGGVRMPIATWASLAGVLLAGAPTFAAMGLALGYWLGPNSAPAVVNLISLPMSLLSGLWIPLPALPAVIRQVAPLLPPYHYARLALRVIGAPAPGAAWVDVTYLVVLVALALFAAWYGFRRDEGRTYG